MEGLEFVRIYIDDLLCLTKGDWTDHLDKLEEVLKRVQKAGLKVNANKSFFGRAELEYLGYWVTRDGVQPLTNKVQAISNIAPPTNRSHHSCSTMTVFSRPLSTGHAAGKTKHFIPPAAIPLDRPTKTVSYTHLTLPTIYSV